MHGQVWEWCEDDWHENYEGAPTDGSAWLKSGEKAQKSSYSVLRGGSWFNVPVNCRSACRNYFCWARLLLHHYRFSCFVCSREDSVALGT
jgi:formylglycine-generating enzyme required for sulfatase activity